VRVGGATAFIGGADPTPERVVAAARSAVATARGLATIAGPGVPLVTSPVVTGEWAAPLEIDPFTVSPDDHFFGLSALNLVNDASGTGAVNLLNITWVAETRVFASSEGSLVTQRLARALPTMFLQAQSGRRSDGWETAIVSWQLPLLVPCTAGFEIVLGPALHEQVQQKLRELEWWAKLPWTVPDVGRKTVVLDGQACATVLGATLLPALSLDRVLGEEQDASGTSFLAPPEAILGQPLLSPHLDISIVTGGTHFGRMQWDDEGVVPEARPLIQHGAVVDYIGTRANLQTLAPWYAKQNRPLRPPGGVWTEDASLPPLTAPGSVVMESASAGPSLRTLAQTMSDGVVVRDGYAHVDHQGMGGRFVPGMLFEVRKGQVMRRLVSTHLEFATRKLFKDIIAVGGAETRDTVTCRSFSGVPPVYATQAVTAPAVQCRDVNLVSSALATQ
jgi:predicted Zn-dependent protease